MGLLLFRHLHLWNCCLGCAEIFRSELKFKEQDLRHNLNMMVSPDIAYIWQWEKNRQEIENGKTAKLEKTEDFLSTRKQKLCQKMRYRICTYELWLQADPMLHDLDTTVQTEFFPCLKRREWMRHSRNFEFWWDGEQHLLGFCFQLFFQIIDLTLQCGNGGLCLGPLSSLQFYQLCLQVLVLPFEQHSPCLQFLRSWSFCRQIYKLSSNTTKI